MHIYFSAAWQGIRQVFPGVAVKGCAFHWSQAVWSHVQEYGLVTTKRETECLHLRSSVDGSALPTRQQHQ